MSDSFEYSGKKYRVTGIVHGNQGIVAHVTPENPFTPGRVYTSQYIADNAHALSGAAVFVGDQGQVLRHIVEGDRWENTAIGGKLCLTGSLTGVWVCVYANERRISASGEPAVSWEVGGTVYTDEEYDSLPDGTIVLDSSRGIAREAIQKRLHGSVRTFTGEKIPHSQVFDAVFPPLTIVHIPDDDA